MSSTFCLEMLNLGCNANKAFWSPISSLNDTVYCNLNVGNLLQYRTPHNPISTPTPYSFVRTHVTYFSLSPLTRHPATLSFTIIWWSPCAFKYCISYKCIHINLARHGFRNVPWTSPRISNGWHFGSVHDKQMNIIRMVWLKHNFTKICQFVFILIISVFWSGTIQSLAAQRSADNMCLFRVCREAGNSVLVELSHYRHADDKGRGGIAPTHSWPQH
jgi:hypothetical protein